MAVQEAASHAYPKALRNSWREIYLKEDWWAIWIGIGLMLVAIALFRGGSAFLSQITINPGGLKWTSLSQLGAHFSSNAKLYAMQYVVWMLLFGITTRVMGIETRSFVGSFTFLYFLAMVTFSISGWKDAADFNLEPPLVALILGVILANVVRLPTWMDAGFRVEYFVKIGIVLLGATFPIALVLTAGPVAIAQATFISLVTCTTIYFLATRVFGLERRLAAVIGVGGSVCGVSASMAISAAVGAKKEDVYTSVTLVVGWALVMVLLLPFISKELGLNAGVAGAWIGTSEFADAAGFAASSAYGKMVGHEASAVQAFTLMKVIGRDLWIGIWAFVWALIATLVWEKKETGTRPDAREIWWRFPKFVIGFFVASIIMSYVSSSYSPAQFAAHVKPGLIMPLVSLRTWAFIFCFLSIGLTTRFRELQSVGWRTIPTITNCLFVNVLLGYYLSVHVFGAYWSRL